MYYAILCHVVIVIQVTKYYWPADKYTKSEATIAIVIFIIVNLAILTIGESNRDNYNDPGGYEDSVSELP